MMFSRFGFHKVIYKRVPFSLQKEFLKFLHRAKVSAFKKKFTPILTMPVFENLRRAGYPFLVLTNWVF
jgi:hypothetical protein